jgi:hypothetical protein
MSADWCRECQKVTSGRCPQHSGVTITTYGGGMTPHCCPVCGGRGWVQPGFYHNPWGASGCNISNETCRSCSGTGVVWR